MSGSRPASARRISSFSSANRYAWLDEDQAGGPSRPGSSRDEAGASGGAVPIARSASARRRRSNKESRSSGAVPTLSGPIGSDSRTRHREAVGNGYFELELADEEQEEYHTGSGTSRGLYASRSAGAELFPHSSPASASASASRAVSLGQVLSPAITLSGTSNSARDTMASSGLPSFTRKTTYSSLPPSPDASILEHGLLPGLRLPSGTVEGRGPNGRPISMLGEGEFERMLSEQVDAASLERELGRLAPGSTAKAGQTSRAPSVEAVEDRLRYRATSLPPETFVGLVHANGAGGGGIRHEDTEDSADEVYLDVEEADWAVDAQAPLRTDIVAGGLEAEPLTPRFPPNGLEMGKLQPPTPHGQAHSHALLPAMERTPSSFRRKSPARPLISRAQTSRSGHAAAGHNLLHRFNSHTGRLGGQAQGHSPGKAAQGRPAGDEGVRAQVATTGRAASSRFSLWELLLEDADDTAPHAADFLIDGKWDRISNFLAIPLAVERVTLLGSLFCLDALLYNFTVLPIRVLFALGTWTRSLFLARRARMPSIAQIQVVMKALLLVIPTCVLLYTTDMSKMYHGVRGQDTIKLYVIFNVLEIADRLCGAFGQDIMDTLFAKATLDAEVWRNPVQRNGQPNAKQERIRGRKRERARPFFFFFLALAYVHLHAIVSLYQLVSLNVAINSYDNALLTLLVSNQFVEIKGSVFKKFDKENLFQITCADIVERFQLALMLSVIAVRNMVEMSGSDFAFLPKSFIRGTNLIETIWSPVLVVICCEMLVDWLKHGFITKFNHVRATCYERYSDILCKDVLIAAGFGRGGSGRDSRRRHASFVDLSPLVTRRIGFASIPLSCLVIRTAGQGLYSIYRSLRAEETDILSTIAAETGSAPTTDAISRIGFVVLKWSGFSLGLVIAWMCLVGFKMTLGLQLLRHASTRVAGMEDREAADRVNDFGRPPIGDSEREKAYAKAVTQHLNNERDDLSPYPPMVKTDRQDELPKGTRQKWRLEDVERWTMVKRIF